MPSRTIVAVAVVLLCSSIAAGELYQWLDDDGVVTFKDVPSPAAKKHKKKIKVYTDDDFDPAPERKAGAVGRKPASPAVTAARQNVTSSPFNGTVEIYVTDWCRYCKEAQAYMRQKGIPFVAYDIEKDRAANQRHKALGGRGVPLIIMGSNRMSGFSAALFEQQLNSSR